MTRVVLLEAMKQASIEATRDLLMPVARQKEDKEEPEPRCAEVYKMRLSDSKAAKKKAPYILHQFITGVDRQDQGQPPVSTATVRTIFCVYHPDEQEGGLALLNLMERLRIYLMEQGTIGNQFRLDVSAGVEAVAYPDDTAPYYSGEMITVWKLPVIERKMNYGTNDHAGRAGKEPYAHIRQPGPGQDCRYQGPGAVHGFYGQDGG